MTSIHTLKNIRENKEKKSYFYAKTAKPLHLVFYILFCFKCYENNCLFAHVLHFITFLFKFHVDYAKWNCQFRDIEVIWLRRCQKSTDILY